MVVIRRPRDHAATPAYRQDGDDHATASSPAAVPPRRSFQPAELGHHRLSRPDTAGVTKRASVYRGIYVQVSKGLRLDTSHRYADRLARRDGRLTAVLLRHILELRKDGPTISGDAAATASGVNVGWVRRETQTGSVHSKKQLLTRTGAAWRARSREPKIPPAPRPAPAWDQTW